MLVRAAAKRWQGYVQAGLLSREIRQFGVPTLWIFVEGNIVGGGIRESLADPARSENQGMCGIFMRENREVPCSSTPLITGWTARGTLRRHARDVRAWEVRHPRSTCEVAEQRRVSGGGGDGGKGPARRTRPANRAPDTEPEQARQVRWIVCAKLHNRIREHGSQRCCTTSPSIACGRRSGRFARTRHREWTGPRWEAYRQDLEDNLIDLHERLHTGRYQAKPSRRAYIPKADGRQRPLGIASLEDKIVQRAVVEVLNAIYEVDFVGFSYGFRPGCGPHDALDALAVGIERRKVNWVLDADVRDFFNKLDRVWLERFLEHRIADRRVLRLIQKWLNAGIVEDGQWSETRQASPQGASVSPLLANVYLHYVFDLWVQWWR